MSNNWYSSWPDGGSSGESNNRRFNNQFSGYESAGQSFNNGNYDYETAGQSFNNGNYGYETAGQSFNNGNYGYETAGQSFNSDNYGCETAGQSFGSSDYGERFFDNRECFQTNVKEENKQKYGDVSTEYIPNYSGNAREGFHHTYEGNYNGDLRQGYGQRYEVNARCNNRGNYRGNFGEGYLQRYEEDRYDVDNFREGFKPKFGNNDRGNLYEINYTSNKSENRDFKVNTGNLEAMSNQGVENYYRYKYNVAGKVIASFKYNMAGKVIASYKYNSAGNVRASYEYNVAGKVIASYKYNMAGKVISRFKYNMAGKVIAIYKYNLDGKVIPSYKYNVAGKVIANYKYQIKEEDVDVKKELIIKSEKNIENSDDLTRLKEMSSKEKAQNYITNLVKEEVTFSKIDVTKETIVKKEMDNRISRSEYFKNQIKDEETSSKNVEENNKKTREMNEAKDEARYHSEASTVTKWNQYACLKPDCPETFQFWQAARRHMEEGCLPNVKRKRGKKVEESKIKSQKLNKLNPSFEEKVQVKIEKYACLKSNCPETFVTWGDARRHMEKGCLPNVKTKKGKKVKRSIKKAKKMDIMSKPMEKKVPVKTEESEVSNLNRNACLKPDCPETFGYACLKPDCPETFQFWGEARRHMAQGCLQTIKSKKCPPTIIYPTIGLPIVLSQKKAKKQRGMKQPMEEKSPLKMEKM